MPRIRNVALDCADPYQLALFWSEVMGAQIDEDCAPGDEEVGIRLPGSPTLFFQRVPEPKAVKNRMHICLEPDVLRDVEIERVVALGATMVQDYREPDGTGWAVLADPEGNEFCVLRSAVECQPAHP